MEWNCAVEQLMTIDEIKQEIEVEPTVLKNHEHRTSRQTEANNGILGVYIYSAFVSHSRCFYLHRSPFGDKSSCQQLSSISTYLNTNKAILVFFFF